MQDLEPKPKRVATTSAALFGALLALILLVGPIPTKDVVAAFARAGAAFTVLGLFWTAYDRIGWRLRALRLGGWLSPAPDLNGRWEGTLRRHGEDPSISHPFTVVVKQSYTKFSYRTDSPDSSGHSETAVIRRVDDHTYEVISSWLTRADALEGEAPRQPFRGCSHWTVHMDEDPPRIEDEYFTERHPPTRGSIVMVRQEKDRRRS